MGNYRCWKWLVCHEVLDQDFHTCEKTGEISWLMFFLIQPIPMYPTTRCLLKFTPGVFEVSESVNFLAMNEPEKSAAKLFKQVIRDISAH